MLLAVSLLAVGGLVLPPPSTAPEPPLALEAERRQPQPPAAKHKSKGVVVYKGRVLGPNEKPVAGAKVYYYFITRQEEAMPVRATTDAEGRFATGGEDVRIALWRPGRAEPDRVVEGHAGPIVGLAVSPDGTRVASASWDGTARVSPLRGEAPARVLEGHQGNVNAVAFTPEGRVVTAGYDGTVRVWPASGEPAG